MKRFLIAYAVLALACQATLLQTLVEKTTTPGQENEPGHQPSSSPTQRTLTPSETPSWQGEVASFQVRLHPDGELYAGDLVSVEVIAPPELEALEEKVQVWLVGEPDGFLGESGFAPYGIGGRLQATMYWVWDTAGLLPGEYRLRFVLTPSEESWEYDLTLHPAEQMPPPQPWARWESTSSDCCLIHYISGTPAEVDLDTLAGVIDEQAAYVADVFGFPFEETVEVTLLPRILGHGGFAGEGIAVSYLERGYTSGTLESVLRHEFTHVLDAQLGGDLRPTLLVEGLAVYVSGGHYKREPLMARAAALLPPETGCIPGMQALGIALQGQTVCGLGIYIPFEEMTERFYFAQHEISYLEAAALVEYMVERWGWEAFQNFYRDIHAPASEGETSQPQKGIQYQAIDDGLREHFGISLAELEEDYLRALEDIRLEPRWVEDVRLTVAFYEAARLYQERLDPSAYYLHAWLPDRDEMQARGIVADFLRRPSRAENLALESMLTLVNASIRQGYYPQAAQLLERVQEWLEELARR